MPYRIFTIEAGHVTPGALVETLALKGTDIEVPAVMVGEVGRGRKCGVLPVTGAAAGDILPAARIGQTRSGNPKLIAAPFEDADDSAVIAVLRTPIGFRGGNVHTGDRAPEWTKENPAFLPFPGKILAEGVIAQGDAGAMGSSQQFVAVIPKGVVFRTAYSGRLYGKPLSRYYLWDGSRMLAATWEERAATDLF